MSTMKEIGRRRGEKRTQGNLLPLLFLASFIVLVRGPGDEINQELHEGELFFFDGRVMNEEKRLRVQAAPVMSPSESKTLR